MSLRDRRFVPCPACNRHVTNEEATCPFCAAPIPVSPSEPPRALPRGRLGRAALIAAGASATLIGGCHTVGPLYGGPFIVDGGSTSDTAASSGGSMGTGGGGAGGAGSGGGVGGTGIKPDAGGVVPLYGAPAPHDGG